MTMHEQSRGVAGTGPSEDEIVQAIGDQLPMCKAALFAQGRIREIDEVMAEVGYELMKSLPRFRERGTVPLAAWANGVARNVLGEAERRNGRKNHYEISLEHLVDPGGDRPAGSVSVVSEFTAVDGDGEDQFFLGLLRIVKERIIEQPHGAAKWAQLERMAQQPVRGRKAREFLREELASVSGWPAAAFGAEPVEDAVAEGVPVEVGPELQSDGFVVSCTLCGSVGQPITSIAETMARVSEHREEHRSGGGAER